MECKRRSEESQPEHMDMICALAPLSPTTFKDDLKKDLSKCYSWIDESISGQFDALSKSDNENGECPELHSSPEKAPSVQPHIQKHPSILKSPERHWSYYFQQNLSGDTPFHCAIMKGEIELVLSLIQSVSSPEFLDIQNDLLHTPLHVAAWAKKADVLQILVCAGADISLLDTYGLNALHISVSIGHLAGVKALMTPAKHGFSHKFSLADLQTNKGLSCVHLATIGGHLEILKYLVQYARADINAMTHRDGDTCLHLACKSRNEESVITLLNLGADPGLPNCNGLTPFMLAKDMGIWSPLQRLHEEA